jgi:Zn-dependent metalloprotease
MKNLSLLLSAAFVTVSSFAFAQSRQFDHLDGANVVGHSKYTGLPNFVKFMPGKAMTEAQLIPWIKNAFQLDAAISFQPYSTEPDKMGFTHIRYKEYIGNYPVDGSMLIAHIQNGLVISFNGDFYRDVNPSFASALTETNALQAALLKVGATKYKWENKDEEAQMRIIKHDPAFTFYPKGTLVAVHKKGNDYSASSIRLAWKFDIYAAEPLSRAYIYVDAQTGEVIAEQQRIHTADVVGTGNTMYSGTQTMTSDNFSAGNYRLRETGRGNGIETYNMGHSTNYTNTDFTFNSSAWNLPVADQAATDAHWGAEMTYDYFMTIHGRNSIDNAGFPLLSYVHYSNNFVNAFWDGSEMTYGDGDASQGFTVLTGLDVCGHEISHGLTELTAGLNGGEADALNEGNSDIFGTTIEHFARPTDWNWIMGDDISTNGLGFRDMSNPNNSFYPGAQPDTYLGNNWDPNDEPHNNNGPQIYWYYLLSMGGSGTNDNGDAYNVTGITIDEAQMIEFRALTVYMTPNTDYMAARMYTIQAAQDIYGACSPEVISTTKAWYAVGVGPDFSSAVIAAFSADVTSSCNMPLTVNFTNTSTNAGNTTWYFGDATTSTAYSPTHIYTNAGTYNVSLAVSSSCGADSIIQTSYITVNPPAAPTGVDQSSCSSATFNLSGSGNGTLQWFATPTGGTPLATGTTFATPVLNTTTTYYLENQFVQPPGNVGPPSYNFGTGGQHNNNSTQYLEFTVYTNCTLATADVNAGAAGNRTVVLFDDNGNQLSQYIVNVPASGVQTVTLNIPLTPGNYRIGGTMMNLYRNNSGANYPYVLNSVASITGSSAGGNYYYYLYNWTMTLPPCTSARVPVVATVGPLNVSFSTAGFDTVCLNDGTFNLSGGSPAGGAYSGPGVSGGIFNPSVAGAGSHTIVYTYTDSTNCTATIPATVVVDDCAGIHSPETSAGISVYPNPANNFVMVELQLGASQEVEMNLVNMLGQTLYSSKGNQSSGITKVTINTASLPRGIYLLQVKTPNGMQVRKIELQ